eukprot:gene15932-10211_t
MRAALADHKDALLAAKDTMRGHIKRIFEEKPANMDEEFGAAEACGDVVRLPTRKCGRDVLSRAVDFLGAKLSDEDGAAFRDPAVQRELCALLGANAQYASAVSKLVLYEASATEQF